MLKPRKESFDRTIEQLQKLEDAKRGSYDAKREYELDTDNMTHGEWLDALIVNAILFPQMAKKILSPFLTPEAIAPILKQIPKWREEYPE